jgi:hypothetical protein
MGIVADLKNNKKDLTTFTIDNLLDALYMLKVQTLDSEEWKEKVQDARSKVIAELEARPVKDLVQALIKEALR